MRIAAAQIHTLARAAREERLVADIELARVRGERQNFNPTGHHSRPDVFDSRVDRRRRAAATFSDGK